MEVLGGMLVFRRIATTDVPTAQAHAKMNPAVADLQALFAALWRMRFHVPDLIEMGALSHQFFPGCCMQLPVAGVLLPFSWRTKPAQF